MSTSNHTYVKVFSQQWFKDNQYTSLLFDTNAIIKLSEIPNSFINDYLTPNYITPLYIHAVHAELMRTDNSQKRTERQLFISSQKLDLYTISQNDLQVCNQLQIYLHTQKCHPEPTDLYLGSKLMSHRSDKLFLITGNTTDFPLSAYTRENYIIAESDKHIANLTILSPRKDLQRILLDHI